MKKEETEFPLLEAIGLYAAEIRGDGNCLFNALSDQMYGNQDHHGEIRAQTIAYMRQHADYYKMFMQVYEGGGTRRNPKRKNAGTYSSNSVGRASPEELDRVFQKHINQMAQGGAWGDNMEIVAFANAFEMNVRIYQSDFTWFVQTDKDSEHKPVLHIAYHIWEHYSSVRNTSGPHEGLPHVNPAALSPEIDNVARAVPQADRETILRVLQEAKGDYNNAIDKILEGEDKQSISSHQSSSVEREVDSDDEMQGPTKRQNRRLSMATMKMKSQAQQRRKNQIASKYDAFGDSLEDLEATGVNGTVPSGPKRQASDVTADDTEEEDWSPGPLKDGSTSSNSEYSSSSTTNLKVELSQPASGPNSPVKPQLKKQRPTPKLKKSAREQKQEMKRLQKLKATERKRAQLTTATAKNHELEAPAMSRSNSNAAMAIRTLYI